MWTKRDEADVQTKVDRFKHPKQKKWMRKCGLCVDKRMRSDTSEGGTGALTPLSSR